MYFMYQGFKRHVWFVMNFNILMYYHVFLYSDVFSCMELIIVFYICSLIIYHLFI